MAAYTTTSLLSSIERRSFSPANQVTFTSTEILALANEVVKSDILPAILDVREEYFTTYSDLTITANQAAYDIPARSIGGVLREVHIINADGKIINVGRTELERLDDTNVSGPRLFYLRGDQIVLYPTPSTTTGTLRLYFSVAPGDFVAVGEVAVISAINTSTNVVTVTTIPSTWVTGDIFDFSRKNGGHGYRGIDYTSTLVSGSDITFSSLPSGLVVGDYLSLQGESGLVQLPPEFRPALSTLAAAEIIMAQNQEGAEDLYAKGQKMLEVAKRLLTPRVIGEDQVIMPDWT